MINMTDTIDVSVESGMISIRQNNAPNRNLVSVYGSEHEFSAAAMPGNKVPQIILDKTFPEFDGGKSAMIDLVIDNCRKLG